MKTTAKIVIMLMIVVFTATSALAVKGGNPKKGKYLYKKHCKACHSADSDGGELTPMSKTMSQWDRLFKKNKHKGGQEAWDKMKPQEVIDLIAYLQTIEQVEEAP